MFLLDKIREKNGLSQRRLAELARLSFRTIQLAEGEGLNISLETLEKIAQPLGYPSALIKRFLGKIFQSPPESVFISSEKIVLDGEASWKIHFFEFVDAFAKAPSKEEYIFEAPCLELPPPLRALFASTVEALCLKGEVNIPDWCMGVSPLIQPWFVSGVENLKATALQESPAIFRKRNLFVLENFLERA